MEILFVIFVVLFQSFIFASVTSIIQKYKYSQRDYIILILGIVIPSIILYFIFGRNSLLYLILCFFIFYFRRAKIIGIITVLLSILILLINDFIATGVFAYLNTYQVNYYLITLIYMVVFALGCYIFSFIVITLFNKLKTSWLYINKLYLIALVLFLASGFIIFFSLLPRTVVDIYEFKYLGIVYFISFSVFAILIIATTLTIEREINYKRKKQELDDYYKYTVQIEKINNKMRKFRHDYTNILLTMSEYLREDDLEGLKKYYHEHISPLKSEFESNTMRLNGIENLKVREIKGLITTKILQAQENDIEITVEVADEIAHIAMDSIQLSRVLGIIMDNAIEASNTINDPIIQIAFIKTDESVMIIIMNKAPKDMPKLHTLFQDGFSTKGKNRGIGLTTLKEIIDQTDNVFLDTTIENHYFIQKLEIMND
ncbi:quorum-sensing sensor histidine kinase AgrC [Staphylococcus cornubiensis]|uniref:quorum-sensing sensor histidine kinase AgrC n=1 Tax=Staphylococcus cornubiensis TaxID=1986155 RepID=UPI000A39C098